MITAFSPFQSLLLNSDHNYCKIGQLIYVHIPMKFLKTNRLAGEKKQTTFAKILFLQFGWHMEGGKSNSNFIHIKPESEIMQNKIHKMG